MEKTVGRDGKARRAPAVFAKTQREAETASDAELFALAIRRNSAHGWQMAEPDKRQAAIRLYGAGTGLSKEEIAETLSVSVRSVTGYLTDIEKRLREERKQRIFDLWMACHTQKEIAERSGVDQSTVSRETADLCDLEALPKSIKVTADFSDSDFETPLYNVWTFSKKTNDVSHFGNSEQRIVENLLIAGWHRWTAHRPQLSTTLVSLRNGQSHFKNQ